MAHILVGIDESEESQAALRFAHQLAAAVHADVIALEADSEMSAEHAPEDARRYLEGVTNRVKRWLTADLAGATEVRVVEDDIVSALHDQAEQLKPYAVVIGSASREGVTPLGLGSHADNLAHHLPCPLVAVPVPSDDRGRRQVVVGVDGSVASYVALRLASELAKGLGGSTFAVYTMDYEFEGFSPGGYYGEEEYQTRREIELAKLPVEFVERIGHQPEDALIDVAREQQAAMLVVAARDRGSLGGLMLGKVPDHLLHHPPCPVMVLPHRYTDAVEGSAR